MGRPLVTTDQRRLSEHVKQERIDRYLSGEPLRLIAADHGVSITTLIRTVERYAPWALGRPRGGGPKRWPA